MTQVADMCTMGGSEIQAGIPFGAIHDVYQDCELPGPQFPKAEHSTKMAGKALGLAAGGLGDGLR
jgi:hypothetical protein